MKKSKLVSALLCSMCLITGSAVPTMADSVKVVTLGADLTEEQKDTMLRYFKVDRNEVQILTITNQDERDHLSSYVPLEQIGTRTVSSAYVKPTQSGGIKVRTANLNWVTCNMIATTLSTSGVKNCEVVAACPFEVSGTGALTGIQMAYETASGEKLDETKKELATAEMVVTGNLADEVGKNDATIVINKAKMEVIKNNVQDIDEIYNIVIGIAEENDVALSSEQLDEIVNLLLEIAQQNYDYDEMKATLERVDANVSDDGELGEVEDATDDTVEAGDIVDGDSIVDDLDESILGSDIIASSTEDPDLEEETGMETETPSEDDEFMEEFPSEDDEFMEEFPSEDDDTVEAGEVVGDEEMTEGLPEAEDDMSEDIQADELDELDTSSLTDEQIYYFNQADTFFKGAYEGDWEALQAAMGEDAEVNVVLDMETGTALTKAVKKAYLDILVEGIDSYVADGTEMYMTTELNMLDKALQEIFGLDENDMAIEALTDVAEEHRTTLYNDTMKFFEKLYGESLESYEDEMGGEESGEMEAELGE